MLIVACQICGETKVIAGTPDGIRVGFGLLSTSNETLPPGRIHSVQVSQPLLWRLPGWWEIRVNRAGRSTTKAAWISRTAARS